MNKTSKGQSVIFDLHVITVGNKDTIIRALTKQFRTINKAIYSYHDVFLWFLLFMYLFFTKVSVSDFEHITTALLPLC